MILKFGVYHLGLNLYKVSINDGPGLTLTNFMARSNWVTCTFEWGKLLQSHLMVENLQRRTLLTKKYHERKTLTSGGCLPLSRGYILVYNHYFQTSSSLKPLGKSSKNFYVEFPEEVGKKVYIYGTGHMTKMVAMPIYGRTFKKSSSLEPKVRCF